MQRLNISYKFIQFIYQDFAKPYLKFKPSIQCSPKSSLGQNLALIRTFQRFKSIILLPKTVGTVISGILILHYVKENACLLQAEEKVHRQLIEEADVLYEQLKFNEIYNLLIGQKDSQNDDILWRLARATYEKARSTQSTEEKKAFFLQALRYLEEADTINANNFAVHKWLAIVMDCYYTMEGTKARIAHLYDLKTHMERACELKPKDGTSWYVLGMWYFGIANLSWYERRAASLFFAAPPQASFQDALEVFLKAEAVEPHFYSQNYLMIGKCLYHLGRREEANVYLKKAIHYEGKTVDDEEAKVEAAKWIA